MAHAFLALPVAVIVAGVAAAAEALAFAEMAAENAAAVAEQYADPAAYAETLQAQAEMAGALPVKVVDTGQASLGLGLAALAAARAAAGDGRCFSGLVLAVRGFRSSAEGLRYRTAAQVDLLKDELITLNLCGGLRFGSLLRINSHLRWRCGCEQTFSFPWWRWFRP